MGALGKFSFILVRPKSAGNVGASARALKNMGLSDLRLVAPTALSRRLAAAMAVHGRDVLDGARTFASLPDAIGDCTLTVGTTCRVGLYRSGVRPIREAAPALAAQAASNRIAIIFGPEDFGLANEDLKLCQQLVTIPTAPEYPSLNLAQAVMIVAYELMLAAELAPAATVMAERASAVAVDAMIERMAGALLAIGFLPAENPDRIMFALRAIFGRAGIDPRELDILSGIAAQIRWVAKGGRETLAAKERAGAKLR